jgi:hypothetical protein
MVKSDAEVIVMEERQPDRRWLEVTPVMVSPQSSLEAHCRLPFFLLRLYQYEINFHEVIYRCF